MPLSPPSPIRRTYSSQFSSRGADNIMASNNPNVSWTDHPSSAVFYFVFLFLVHVFISANLDTYFHTTLASSTATSTSTPPPAPLSVWSTTFGLGSSIESGTPRLWYFDAYTLTALLHGFVTGIGMHWVKGSANDYDQGEFCDLTWYEQLAVAGNWRTYYSTRLLVTVPSVLCLVACAAASYELWAVVTHVTLLAVLVVSKMRFMHGVRVFGINKTVGVDDGASSGGHSYEGERFKRE